jgi:hypothetical protein
MLDSTSWSACSPNRRAEEAVEPGFGEGGDPHERAPTIAPVTKAIVSASPPEAAATAIAGDRIAGEAECDGVGGGDGAPVGHVDVGQLAGLPG